MIYMLFYIPLFIVSMVTFNRTMSCHIENFLLCILIKVIMTSKITSRRIRTDITFDHIVVLPKETSYKVEDVFKATRSILDIYGCPNCHSGRDILFKNEESMMRDIRNIFANDFVINKELRPRPLGEAFNITL